MGSKLKDRLTKRRKELADRSEGGNFIFIKEGTTKVRALPAGDEKDWAIEIVYFYLGDKIKGVVSPKTIGKKCAIHEAYEELSKSKKPADRELAGKFKPQRRYLMVAVRYKDEKSKELDLEQGPRMVFLTNGLYQDLLDLYLDDDNGDFTDPEEGYDLKFKRTGTGKTNTEYSVLTGKNTPLPKKLRKELYDPTEMLEKLKIVPTYKDTKEKLETFLSGADLGDEEEKRSKKKKKKKSGDL